MIWLWYVLVLALVTWATLYQLTRRNPGRRRWQRVKRQLGVGRQRLTIWRHAAPMPTLLFLGWLALTAGVAEIGAPRVVWPISAGLFAWGLYGFRPIGTTFWLGVNTLKHIQRRDREDR